MTSNVNAVAAADHAAPTAQTLMLMQQLQLQAQGANTPVELGFVMANATFALAPYRQALSFLLRGEQMQLQTASGLVSVAEDSPFAVWVTRFAKTLPRTPGCHLLHFSEAPEQFRAEWQEWLPDHLLCIPLMGPQEQHMGTMLYAREEDWTDHELPVMAALHNTYGYCLWALSQKKRSWLSRLRGLLRRKWLWLLLVLAAVMCIPVRLSVLAPAEVIALNAVAVAAPLDGVISAFAVMPNANVKKGDLLFSLDDSAVRSRREVASKALEVARADALVAQQRAFDELKSKGEIASSTGRVQEKEAELAAVVAQSSRVEIRAPQDGVAIFTDSNDWLGKPLQTGERVMQIASPNDAGLLAWLPVADALVTDAGAPVKVFLHTQPLEPLQAELLQASYQAISSPEGVMAYRLRAKFSPETPLPRIGLRGTARISGEWTILGYYLLRRPLAAVRQLMGV